VRKQAYAAITRARKLVEKADLAIGFHRAFTFLDQEEEERSRVSDDIRRPQFSYRQVFEEVEKGLIELFDVTATKDYANMEAKADIVVDGQTLMMGAPVTYLLFLEKQLNDIHTFIASVTELPTDQEWERDGNSEFFVAHPQDTVKTKKVTKHVVVVPATEHHPAQVAEDTQDVVMGTWTNTLYGGAISRTDKAAILERINNLRDAVKFAREEANSIEVQRRTEGVALLGYIFGDQ
jgi:hypothetical protein